MRLQEKFLLAAEAIRNSRAMIITAGAGMGVDSGLPDFRGDQGFWKAYPIYEGLGVNFYEVADPAYFVSDPAFGWGFYGHRTDLYRKTVPHDGFYLLLNWIKNYRLDYFVVTSNVDGQFSKAGFAKDSIYEVHGSIHYLQCIQPCSMAIWGNNENVIVDHKEIRARNIPRCPKCGDVARPNILMFGDFSWISTRTDNQENKFEEFLKRCGNEPLVVVEMGAGTVISTIRRLSERLGDRYKAKVIRINPRDPQISKHHISLDCGALEGLRGIDMALHGIS